MEDLSSSGAPEQPSSSSSSSSSPVATVGGAVAGVEQEDMLASQDEVYAGGGSAGGAGSSVGNGGVGGGAGTPGHHLMQAQMEKYGSALFQKTDGCYRCFFIGCGKKLQANFSRHVAKHEAEGDLLDETLIKSVRETVPITTMGEGVPKQHCANPRHREIWGTDPELPATEFYNRSYKCKKCYIKQQMERKRLKSSSEADIHEASSSGASSSSSTINAEGDHAKRTDPSPSKRRKTSKDVDGWKGGKGGGRDRHITTKLGEVLHQIPTVQTNIPSTDLHSCMLPAEGDLGVEDKMDHVPQAADNPKGYVDSDFSGSFHLNGYLEGVGLNIQLVLGGRSYKGFVVNQVPDDTQNSYDKIVESAETGQRIIMNDVHLRQLSQISPHTHTGNSAVVVVDSVVEDHHGLHIIDTSIKDDSQNSSSNSNGSINASDVFNNHI